MRVKNTTPFRFASRPTSMDPPSIRASLVLRGAFALAPGILAPREDELGLAQGNLRGETYAADDDDRTGAAVYPGDFADWKPHAEVLFVGAAHAPQGKPVTELPVKLALGGWSKALLVSGPRVWVRSVLGDAPSAPLPFTQQRIAWSDAAGGPDSAENPVGRGKGHEALPAIEHAGERARAPADRVRPAGFGPVSSAWPVRVARRGARYDAAWRSTRAPFWPVDFDGTYFQSAPRDQWLDAFPRGDERLILTNLHPSIPILEASLPALRPRAFVRDVSGSVHEARFVLDTVFVDGDAETVFLTWRASVPSNDVELRDLRAAIVAVEPLSAAARPSAEYVASLDAFERDPIGADAIRDVLAKKIAEVADELPGASASAAAGPIQVPAGTAAKFGDLGAPLVKKLEGLVADVNRALPASGEAGKRVADAAKKPPKPSPDAKRELADRLDDVVVRLTDARARAVASNAPPEVVARLDAALADPRLAGLSTASRRLRPPTDAELVPGADLSGRDLSDMDLSGKDLSGANLTDADLSRARLVGTRLRGATLDRARLIEAELEAADLEGARMHWSTLLRVNARGARLVGATLEDVQVVDVDLSGVDLSKATLVRVLATRPVLTSARLAGITLERSLLSDAALDDATFEGASLVRTAVHGASLRRANLRDARIDAGSFNESNLESADLRRARGARVSFFRAKLDRADLRRAVLTDCHFSEASLAAARLFAADLRLSRFRLAKLDDADFQSANLFGADLGRASVDRAVFRRANLFETQWFGAAGKGVDFVDANLGLSTFELGGPTGVAAGQARR